MTSAADRSWAVFPAGSQGEYDLPRELTLVLARGEGATVWDTDGRAFIDAADHTCSNYTSNASVQPPAELANVLPGNGPGMGT